ncbi:ATP-binding protein [Halalkalibaculum sp. DA384]|uniref:HAMP domain-containing sensor histidine kinase n=1 Tax=Halalkalibaculum sp. DA384 TaxID=3373606 RepID=UPI003754B717
MKLNNKILISNIVLTTIIILLTSVGMYYLVNETIYEELDNHLLRHKVDLMNQLQKDPSSLSHIQDLGGLGSYEWIDIVPYDGSVEPNSNSFTSVDTLRFAGKQAAPQTYRRLKTTVSVSGVHYTVSIYEEVAAWERISMTILFTLLAGLLIWILVLYIVNQVVFDKILTPFYNTVETLEKISDPTDFGDSFPQTTTYEINVLNQALNTMMAQIRSSFEDQKKFIQNASHELLTPLSIIRQKSEKILSQSNELDQNIVESASEIQQTAIRLSRLSNALLLISRVENKQYTLDEQVNIQEVTHEVLEELCEFINLKNISLDKQFNTQITVEGNRELIHSAIYNIIQNAVKFSPEHATITIATGRNDGHPRLSIRDQGPGIPPPLLDSLFDRFKKGSNHFSELDEESSPGLGLSIAQSICQLHGFTCTAGNLVEGGAEIGIQF